MPSLARVLQDGFSRALAGKWTIQPEAQVRLPDKLHNRLGFTPQVDVLMERADGRRLWVELEISRADPVANQAKFATVHLFKPFDRTNTFVSMVSPHVARGRRNLCSDAVELMRRVGIDAYQTVLLPHLGAEEVKRLNHLPYERLRACAPDVRPELDRLFKVVEPFLPQHRIHYAPDIFDVMLNIDAWNSEILTAAGMHAWGRRTIEFFAFDRSSSAFAPSKFCAFVPVTLGAGQDSCPRTMSIGTYAGLDESESRFDGHVARRHLVERLGLLLKRGEEPSLDARFDSWLREFGVGIGLNSRGPKYIVPPKWY
jgi:hypothetical protein